MVARTLLLRPGTTAPQRGTEQQRQLEHLILAQSELKLSNRLRDCHKNKLWSCCFWLFFVLYNMSTRCIRHMFAFIIFLHACVRKYKKLSIEVIHVLHCALPQTVHRAIQPLPQLRVEALVVYRKFPLQAC